MADNTLQTGSDNIATDDLTTLNGGAVSGVKAQRTKAGWGADGTFNDVSTANPLPITMGAYQALVTGAITSTTSTITATDLRGIGSANVQVSGTYAGVTFTIEGSVDGSIWFVIPFVTTTAIAPAAITTVTPGSNVSALYTVAPLLGINQLRVRATAWTSGSAAIAIEPSSQTAPLQTYVGGTVGISGTPSFYPTARNSGGSTAVTLISAASTNATLVKASAAVLFSLEVANTTTTVAYLKLYNMTTAPTVGTSVAYKTIMLPANSQQNIPFGMSGVNFPTGLSYALTGLATTADTTAVAAGQILLGLNYN